MPDKIELNKRTTISLGLLIALWPIITFYFTTQNRTEAHANRIEKLESSKKEMLEEIKSVNDKLSLISSDIKIIKYRLNKER